LANFCASSIRAEFAGAILICTEDECDVYEGEVVWAQAEALNAAATNLALNQSLQKISASRSFPDDCTPIYLHLIAKMATTI
jgi:mannose/cellobiose epimerase-like protein (N-acyl-D-glucosamine 2-epimerase family)